MGDLYNEAARDLASLWALVGEMQHHNPAGTRELYALKWLQRQCGACAGQFFRVPGLQPADFDPAVGYAVAEGISPFHLKRIQRGLSRGKGCPCLVALRGRAHYLGPGEAAVATRSDLVSARLWTGSDSSRLHLEAGLVPALYALRWMPQFRVYHLLILHTQPNGAPLHPAATSVVKMLWSTAAWLLGPDAPAGESQSAIVGPVPNIQCVVPKGLSPRLAEVFERLRTGQSAKAIADDLCISVHTVYEHMQRLYDRLGVRNRLDLLRVYGAIDQSSKSRLLQ